MIMIEPAISSDVSAILELEMLVHGELVTSIYDLAMFIEFCHVYVARMGNRVVGAIMAVPTKNGEIKVNDWVVHPEFQRQGIGLQLYQMLITNSKGKDLLAMVLQSNARSLHLHQKLGFVMEKEFHDPFQAGEGKGVLLRFKSSHT